MKRFLASLFMAIISVALWAQQSEGPLTHKVRAGETMASIAQQYNLTVAEIEAANPAAKRYVYSGMVLTIPQHSVSTASDNVQSQEQAQSKEQTPKAEKTTQPVQTEKTTHTVQTETPKQTSGRKKTASMQLNYVTFTHANAATVRNSGGMAINGVGEQSIIVKGNDLHLTDHMLHIHTILRPSQGIAYVYSDVTKRGLQLKFEYYVGMFLSNLARTESQGGYATCQYEIHGTGKSVKHNNQPCNVYTGHVITPSQKVMVDMWVNERYAMTQNMKYLLYGIEVQGVPVRYVLERKGVSGYSLDAGSIAAELKSIEERTVNDEEFAPSPDIRITVTNNASMVDRLLQDNISYLKKNGMYPEDAEIESDARYTIDGDWDFVY